MKMLQVYHVISMTRIYALTGAKLTQHKYFPRCQIYTFAKYELANTNANYLVTYQSIFKTSYLVRTLVHS